MTQYHVYKITVLPLNKFYIGCSKKNPKTYKGTGGKEWRAILKEYSWPEDFNKEVILVGSFDECSNLEGELLEEFVGTDNCMNKHRTKYFQTEEECRKIADSQKGKKIIITENILQNKP